MDILEKPDFNESMQQTMLEIESMQEEYLEGTKEGDKEFTTKYVESITAVPSKIMDCFFKIMDKNMEGKQYKDIRKRFKENKNNIAINSDTYMRDVFRDSIETALYPTKTDKEFQKKRAGLVDTTITALQNGFKGFKLGKNPAKPIKKL